MKWLADENFRNAILRGLLRRVPDFEVVRAQDIEEVRGKDDAEMLGWATRQGRVVMTHDLATMVPAIIEQRRANSLCAPVVLVPDSLPVMAAVEDILLLEACSNSDDWIAGVVYLPLR